MSLIIGGFMPVSRDALYEKPKKIGAYRLEVYFKNLVNAKELPLEITTVVSAKIVLTYNNVFSIDTVDNVHYKFNWKEVLYIKETKIELERLPQI